MENQYQNTISNPSVVFTQLLVKCVSTHSLTLPLKHCLQKAQTKVGLFMNIFLKDMYFIIRSNKSLQKYFAALDQSLLGMELMECYGAKFDKTKHGSLFLSKVCDLSWLWLLGAGLFLYIDDEQSLSPSVRILTIWHYYLMARIEKVFPKSYFLHLHIMSQSMFCPSFVDWLLFNKWYSYVDTYHTGPQLNS